MTGAWFGLTRPVPTDADAYASQLRDFAATTYGPAATAWAASRTPASAALLDQLVDLTGAPRGALARQRRPRCHDLSQPAPCRASCSAATTRASPRRSAARSRRRATRRRP